LSGSFSEYTFITTGLKGVEMKKLIQDLSVSAIGAITSILTAILLFVIEDKFGFAFYSWTFWFIVPVGAILSGLCAASGYYAGARLFRARPTPWILVNMITISIITFFLIYYMSYITIKVDGQPLREIVSFQAFLDTIFRHESLSFRFGGHEAGSSGELGSWGYVHAILQVLGFAIGGLAVYAHLSALPYCTRCSIYFTTKGKQTRYDSDPELIAQKLDNMKSLLAAGDFQTAIDIHADYNQGHKKADHIFSQFQLKICPKCAMQWLRFSVSKLTNGDWKELDNFTFVSFHDGELTLPEKGKTLTP
jgi:hypothetical protein